MAARRERGNPLEDLEATTSLPSQKSKCHTLNQEGGPSCTTRRQERGGEVRKHIKKVSGFGSREKIVQHRHPERMSLLRLKKEKRKLRETLVSRVLQASEHKREWTIGICSLPPTPEGGRRDNGRNVSGGAVDCE